MNSLQIRVKRIPILGQRSPPAARAQAAEQKDAPGPPPLLPRQPRARFQGPAGRPQPRPPSHARGPAATAAALAWLADIAAALSARASRATVLPQLLSGGGSGRGGAERGDCASAGGRRRGEGAGGGAKGPMASAAPRASGRLRGSRRAEVLRRFEVVSERPATMQICNHAHLQKSEVWAPTMVSLKSL